MRIRHLVFAAVLLVMLVILAYACLGTNGEPETPEKTDPPAENDSYTVEETTTEETTLPPSGGLRLTF